MAPNQHHNPKKHECFQDCPHQPSPWCSHMQQLPKASLYLERLGCVSYEATTSNSAIGSKNRSRHYTGYLCRDGGNEVHSYGKGLIARRYWVHHLHMWDGSSRPRRPVLRDVQMRPLRGLRHSRRIRVLRFQDHATRYPHVLSLRRYFQIPEYHAHSSHDTKRRSLLYCSYWEYIMFGWRPRMI